MNQGQETPKCAFCTEPAIGGIKIGSGKHWQDVNEPIFQMVLPGGILRETVVVSKGDVVCLDSAGGKSLAKVRAAAAAAAREPRIWPASFKRRRTYAFFGKMWTGMAVATRLLPEEPGLHSGDS